nr:prolyl oligopeptidase family serine peptidase [Singulisphaera sp. GP187]
MTGPDDGLDPAGPDGEFSCRVQCAVDLYGPAELSEYHDLSMLGKSIEEASELYRKASPTSYADKHDPPVLILHGTADQTVALKQSELFAAALQRGEPCTSWSWSPTLPTPSTFSPSNETSARWSSGSSTRRSSLPLPGSGDT